MSTFHAQDVLQPEELAVWFAARHVRHPLIVCDQAVQALPVMGAFASLSADRFDRFEPNPTYASVREGIQHFIACGCDALIAIGGGSAMDVAKCIKLWAHTPEGDSWLTQPTMDSGISLIAMPTTAGTGSEATPFAVIYEQGIKQSITHASLIPDAIIMDPSVLLTLPERQRKATMLDALSHAMESFWSIHSTDESMLLSERALRDILQYQDGYLSNQPDGNLRMLWAAHTAGQAIAITQTTAGHALCYKLTSLLGLPHGQAAGLVNSTLWPWMVTHAGRTHDPRGQKHLTSVMARMAACFGAATPMEGAQRYAAMYTELFPDKPVITVSQLDELCGAVNLTRLRNHPIPLTEADIRELYLTMLEVQAP